MVGLLLRNIKNGGALLFFFFCFASLLFADTWTSDQGVQIEADFVAVNGKSVIIKKGTKTYILPFKRLSPESVKFALFKQQHLKQWAVENANSPILTEQILLKVILFDPELTKNKNYLVEGYVSSIKKYSGLSKGTETKVNIVLEGRTPATIDFNGIVDGARTKIQVKDKSVVLLKARTPTLRGKGWTDYTPEKNLLAVGKRVVIRASIKNGKIHASGIATSAEVTRARLEYAQMHGGISLENAVEFERINARIEFLEDALKGNAGTATIEEDYGVDSATVTFRYSEAQKKAMRREIELLRAQIAAASKRP